MHGHSNTCPKNAHISLFLLLGDANGLTEAPRPTSFTYNELKSATGDFDDRNKLGRGGFSTVYKVNAAYHGHIYSYNIFNEFSHF